MTTPPSEEVRPQPTLVIVSGRPGAGKSTLARRLAQALRCPLVSRDDIHDGSLRTLSGGSESVDREAVAKRSFDTFFGALALLLSRDVTVVAEAAFQDMRWRPGLEPLLPSVQTRIVRCVIDTEVARDRVVRRRRMEGRTEANLEPGSPIVRPFTPLSLPVPTLVVSTADGYLPSLEDIIAFAAS